MLTFTPVSLLWCHRFIFWLKLSCRCILEFSFSITDSKFLSLTLSFCYHSFFQIVELFVDQTDWFNHRKFCVQFYLCISHVETMSVWNTSLLIPIHLAFDPQSTFVVHFWDVSYMECSCCVYVKKNYWFRPLIGWEPSCFGRHHFLCPQF